MAVALIVDDDEVQIEYYSALLARWGYVIAVARDGMEALDLCMSGGVDLVVTDVRMPRLDGISFVRHLLKFSPSSPPRIIVTSSMDDSVTRRKALEAGASSFLVKPVAAADFKAAVEGVQA